MTITCLYQMPALSFQIFAFLGEALVAMNWAVMADILLVSSHVKVLILVRSLEVRRVHFSLQYIVIPNRRSTAEALQVMFIHLLGDCGSPYIVGAVRSSSPSGLVRRCPRLDFFACLRRFQMP